MRISVAFRHVRLLLRASTSASCRGDAEADHVDAGRAGRVVVGRVGVVLAGVEQAAQRQRQRAELARQRERLGLARRELERRGLADHDALAVLFLDRLVDREHAHVGQDRFAGVDFDAGGLLGFAVAARQDHVDTVVRQDEAAGAGLGRDFGRDRAHAGRQDRRHEAGAVGLDQLGFADRLAGGERRRARSSRRAASMASGRSFLRMKFGPAAAAGQVCQCRSLAGHALPSRCRSWRSARRRCRAGRPAPARPARARSGTPGQQRGDAAGGEGNDENNDTRGFHTLHFPHDAATDSRRHFDTMPPPNTWSAHSGFQQAKVNSWLMSRIQIELMNG